AGGAGHDALANGAASGGNELIVAVVEQLPGKRAIQAVVDEVPGDAVPHRATDDAHHQGHRVAGDAPAGLRNHANTGGEQLRETARDDTAEVLEFGHGRAVHDREAATDIERVQPDSGLGRFVEQTADQLERGDIDARVGRLGSHVKRNTPDVDASGAGLQD